MELDAPTLALLPGSRLGEIRRLLPIFLDAAARLAERIPRLQVLVPAANAECRAAIAATTRIRRAPAGLRLLDGHAHEAMIAADVVLLASGTAALEAMLAKRPMVVGYKISMLTYRLVMGLGLMKVTRFSLPNVLANEPIVTELMQHDCTAENLADALLPMFTDPEVGATLESRYLAIHRAPARRRLRERRGRGGRTAGVEMKRVRRTRRGRR